jgi:hypothetical protein
VNRELRAEVKKLVDENQQLLYILREARAWGIGARGWDSQRVRETTEVADAMLSKHGSHR